MSRDIRVSTQKPVNEWYGDVTPTIKVQRIAGEYRQSARGCERFLKLAANVSRLLVHCSNSVCCHSLRYLQEIAEIDHSFARE